MAQVLSIVEGVFGRACLLDKDRRVGPHAHPEPQVIIKIDGADFAYDVGEAVAPCTRDRIVLVNALQLHGNHIVGKGRSVILSLYLSPHWLVEHHASLLAGGQLFHRASEQVPPRTRSSSTGRRCTRHSRDRATGPHGLPLRPLTEFPAGRRPRDPR